MSLFFSLALASLPVLPEPITNNAAAKVIVNEQPYLLSFMGLIQSKDHHSVHNKVWALKLGYKIELSL
ncbi:hypothetical protein [Pseudoalteromonas prydzensis]|uniref:hypothetical protein n=1 Tax=Pseudoalteromonas prydzensis TaxID=182141 RepID=UPI0039C92600